MKKYTETPTFALLSLVVMFWSEMLKSSFIWSSHAGYSAAILKKEQ